MPSQIGPVILDLQGVELTQEDQEILRHPLVGGVIFFTRHYESPDQIAHFCKQIRLIKKPLLLTVDHEGGKVQRFREGFTAIPAMGELGKMYDISPDRALKMAEDYACLMASELLSVGIDLSFAPVLDINKGLNPVTDYGRPFHSDPTIVLNLAKAYIRGMNRAGMAATGKHFPGHGGVMLDSHLAMPEDDREWPDLLKEDLIPFVELIKTGIQALMPAHILFKKIDHKPVGFSSHWLKTLLRQQLNFKGMIFSDDLNMKGAGISVNYADRAQAALEAGCDMVLICNNRDGAIQILDNLSRNFVVEKNKFAAMQGKLTKQEIV